MNKGLPEIFQNMILVFKKRKSIIFFLILINTIISILLSVNVTDFLRKFNELINSQEIYIEYEKFLDLFNSKYFLMILISILIPLITYGILAIICNEIIFEIHFFPSRFKRFLKYIMMYLVLVFIIIVILIAYIFISVIFLLIPFLGIILFLLFNLAFIAFLIYFFGYYRFIPYVAVTDDMSSAFEKSKLYIKGNFIISVITLIFNIAINEIMSWIFSEYVYDIIILSIIIFILETIIFSLYFFNISLVYTGKKSLTNKKVFID